MAFQDLPWEMLVLSEDQLGSFLRFVKGFDNPNRTESCWNWRDCQDFSVEETIEGRGYMWNGHPVSAEYFGSFCLDGAALAWHCCYTTDNLQDCIRKCINLRGDSDTTAAICGQIAGAFYGVRQYGVDICGGLNENTDENSSSLPRLLKNIEKWDGGRGIGARTILLAGLGMIRA